MNTLKNSFSFKTKLVTVRMSNESMHDNFMKEKKSYDRRKCPSSEQ